MDGERIEVNGTPATLADLRYLVQTNYGHFSAMRVEAGGIRGLDLHLARLDAATQALFGSPLPAARVRDCLRHAVAGEPALSLRVNVFSRALDRERLAQPATPDILVIASPPRVGARTPLSVQSVRYLREAPALKHVGTFALFEHRRRAQQAGFDDALFVADDGTISEGSIWNIGFVAADGIVWPQAPQLAGVSMQLLQRGLAEAGIASQTRPVRLEDLSHFDAAFFSNASVPVRAVARIDAHAFAGNDAMLARLDAVYAAQAPQPI